MHDQTMISYILFCVDYWDINMLSLQWVDLGSTDYYYFEFWLLTSLFIWDHFVIRIKNEWGLVTVYRLDVNPIVQIVFDLYDCILWGFCCDDFDCHIKLNLSVAFKSWLMHIRGQDVIEYAGCFGILFQMTFTCRSLRASNCICTILLKLMLLVTVNISSIF